LFSKQEGKKSTLTQSHLVIYCPTFIQFILQIYCDADLTLGVNQIRSSPVLNTRAQGEISPFVWAFCGRTFSYRAALGNETIFHQTSNVAAAGRLPSVFATVKGL
jgi:hypothetical protein